jgi:hypothetical protein
VPDAALFWNEVLFAAATTDSQKPMALQEQGGPTRTSRAAALVHTAVHDAVNGVTPVFPAYQVALPGTVPSGSTPDEAADGAAHRTLCALYPSQGATFDTALASRRAATGAHPGEAFGRAVADQLLILRAADGSDNTGNVVAPLPDPNPWRPHPVLAPPGPGLDPHWGNVAHFTLSPAVAEALRPPPFPCQTSGEYATAFEEVYVKGSRTTPPPPPIPAQPALSGTTAARTSGETEIARFWSYDDGLGTPIRLYNENVRQVLAGSPLTGSGASALHKHAQVLALVNLAMADAGICCWEAKYRYNVLRPFQGIREGFAAGNPGVITDVLWLPLGRPGPPAGSTGPTAFPESTTPNFPAYVSGHSTFGTATFAMLRKIYGTDTVPFQLTSAQTGTTRSYASFSEAHDENGRSRVFLGVHWSFDDQEGQTLGQRVADHIWDRSLLRS